MRRKHQLPPIRRGLLEQSDLVNFTRTRSTGTKRGAKKFVLFYAFYSLKTKHVDIKTFSE